MRIDMVEINRAPVLTLWAAVVAGRLGFSWEEALSLGKAVAGLNAQAKGRALGISEPGSSKMKEARKRRRGEEFWVQFCGRAFPAKNTGQGVRAVLGESLLTSENASRYLKSKFGDALERTRAATEELVAAFDPEDLAVGAFSLYEELHPEIPRGKRGWGVKGELDPDLIRSVAAEA